MDIDKLFKNCKAPVEKESRPLTDEHEKIKIDILKDLLKRKDEFNLSERVIKNIQNYLKELGGQ